MQTIHGRWTDSPEAVTLIDAHHHLWDLSDFSPEQRDRFSRKNTRAFYRLQ